MKEKEKVKHEEEDGRKAIQAARRLQLRKEISKRMGRPGAIAEAVKAEVVRLGFSPREVYAEMFRQS